ncbi:hypothetical protein [Prosthecochloris vibrioformis]|uniref:Uncharacterized protein n=1 Tax=Prosthecochloris vibrioformis TaxID=1098 RepID=A0A5C4S1M0_PROVB|nr:hypothetical protein [Prosthecochloris vibrioformis]TNJ37058.1 hypothetical protein FGF68_05675 [Prosthecochloris vibrioformis]
MQVSSGQHPLPDIWALEPVRPAGDGIELQDIGYLVFFAASGIPEFALVGGAFVLLRRTKDIIWCKGDAGNSKGRT